MARSFNETQQKELEHIKNWSVTILDFMMENHKETLALNEVKDLILKAYNAQNLRGMRAVLKDVNEWANGLSEREKEGLNKILKERFGSDLKDHDKKSLLKVEAIIKNGFIKNGGEYKLLETRVDEIFADPAKKKEVDNLNSLLLDFEKSLKK